MAYYIPPPEKVGGHGGRVPHQIAPMPPDIAYAWLINHKTAAKAGFTMQLLQSVNLKQKMHENCIQ